MNKKKIIMAVGRGIGIVELIFGCVWTFIFGASGIVCSFDYKEFGTVPLIFLWGITLLGIFPILDAKRRIKKSAAVENREAEGNTNTNADMNRNNSSFITCTCPFCNGVNHIQAGKMETCEYCGSKIKV